MRRSHVLLAGAACVAGIAFARAGGTTSAPAEIAGTSLAPPADEVVSVADSAPVVVSSPNSTPTATPSPPDAKPMLDLEKVVRVEDHYEAPMADGRTAILTLDPVLQEAAEKLLVESRAPKGAIVAMAPDGKILALAGRRATEPKGSTEGTFDPHLATDAWAPAASVFKLVTASALVGAGVDPDDKIAFHGGVRSVMESNLHDDKRDSGTASLAFGVAHSNNAIVGKFAYQHLEPAALAKLAHAMGIDTAYAQIPAIAGKLALPDTHDLEFAKAAAGFVGTDLSAVGGAVLAATFADDGEQPTPYLIDKVVGTSDTPVHALHRVVTAEVAHAVTRMMVQTCDIGSAAKSFHGHKVRVAGKTGTLTRTEPFYMEHSWFVGYAPVEKPTLIVAVVLGNPENWHLRGQEAARRLIDLALGAKSREKDRAAKSTAQRDKRNQW